MKISRQHWLQFSILAVCGFLLWYRFSYPLFSFINLRVDQQQAAQIAQDYLSKKGEVDPSTYRQATVFTASRDVDQYLQKAIGYRQEITFLQEHNYELFAWRTRFFQEGQKEEYSVTVSASTGEVIEYGHAVEASAARPDEGKEAAQQKALDFLKQKFYFDPERYELQASLSRHYDYRTDHSFTWAKKGVFVKWNEDEDSGGAKLLVSATVAGDEVLRFNKARLDIPEQFRRHIARLVNVGYNFAIFFRIAFFVLLTSAIFFVVVRRNDLVMHTTKNFCIGLTVFIFFLYVLAYFNQFQQVLYRYPTTASMKAYLWQTVTQSLMDMFIVTISILMPCLAGESLRYETAPRNKQRSFLHNISSTFFSRGTASQVVLGYLVAVILIGIQAAAFRFGQEFLGVWVEYTWMTQMSASYFPFFSAFIVGFTAATTEEIGFRLFSIHLGLKYLRSTVLAVILASVLWGFGHSTYMVFPMWFRGLEVTLLGLFLSFIYLRYGIIAVITAHYLFDFFWSSSAHLLGHSTAYYFYSSIAILLLPLAYAGLSAWLNRPETARPLRWKLTPHQLFNLEVLKHYLRDHQELLQKPIDQLKGEVAAHGWDLAVVETAVEDLHPDSKRDGT